LTFQEKETLWQDNHTEYAETLRSVKTILVQTNTTELLTPSISSAAIMRLVDVEQSSSPSFEGTTLILPFVGIGNVGQLAMDLIIETTRAPRVARLFDSTLLPCCGVGAFTHVPSTCYALELFSLPNSNAILLQQRSPASPGRQQEFAESVVAWAKAAGIVEVRT